MARTLFSNGRVLGAPDDATFVAVEDGLVLATGMGDGATAYDGADDVVDLRGALVTPGFVDAHVHTVRTGFARTGLDLAGSASLTATLDGLRAFGEGHPGHGVLVGQGWDETDWPERRPPTTEELERAAPGRRTYLTRVDGHSSVVSPALAALVPGLSDLDGWTPDGRVERDAHHAVRAVLEGLIGPEERLDAARAACRAMAAAGITAFHENAAPHIGPEHEIELVRQAAAETGLHATVYWGELMAVDTARRLGVAGLAGDLVADGAFGSRTAALTEPYADRPGSCGHGYVSAEQVHDHVVACTRAGLQAGFHCIGDAALEEIREGLEAAERDLGSEALRRARHRLEHVEMPTPAMLATLSRLGVVASVQPMFDALWGGPTGMYAARLGDRWSRTNPFRSLADAPVTLALGSDSPVTPLGPWAAIRAAVHHHHPEQRLPVGAAFHAHTRGGALAGRDDEGGRLRVGARADLAVWDVAAGLGDDGHPDLTPGAPLPRLLRTVAAGRTIHTTEDAS
ncbi:MAG TPA: amidohydrolase [Pedococcus sp.]